MLQEVFVLNAAFLQRNHDALCDAFGIDDRYLMELRQRKHRGPVAVQMIVSVL